MAKKNSNTAQVVRRRMRGPERRQHITSVAAQLFAAHGFSVSTRRISEQLGVSQATLYKHFKSKEEIVEAVFRQRYLEEKTSDFRKILESTHGDLVDRLSQAYLSFFDGITETGIKLFHRASWDGLEIAQRYSPHLDVRILWPVLEQVRLEAKLPPLSELPHMKDERELALMLHSTIVFLGIRKHVYRIDFKGGEPHLIREYVQVWLTGALKSILRYHQKNTG